MKKKRILLFVSTIAFFSLFSLASLPVAHAQRGTVPAQMRGTWYHYDKGQPYFKIKLTSHSLFERDYFEGRYHYYNWKVDVSSSNHRSCYAINPVNKSMGPIAFYKYSPIKIEGRWHKSLQFREGITYNRLFKTKVPHGFNKTVSAWY